MNSARLQCDAVARASLSEPIKREGTELLYRCPYHERHKNGDAHPSLKVNPAKNVFMCGPCGASGTAWQLAAFLAKTDPGDKKVLKAWLRGKGLLPKPAQKRTGGSGRGPVVAEFIHEDASGNPVCKKRRHEPGADGKPKDYTWQRFEGGQWVDGLGTPPLKPPLYRLPEIEDEPLVFLFESHTDVDRAVSMGLAATTSGGADSWRPEYLDTLASKSVCLIPDNDPAGGRYQVTVCAGLYGKVLSLKVVSIAPHPDFRRWADAGGTVDLLHRLHTEAPEWKVADGSELLNSTVAFVRRFVSLTTAQKVAVALWAAHTHALESAGFTPYLNINSAEKESGKSRLLEVLKLLVANPWGTENASAAAMVRKIHGGFENGKPVTVLFDERDSQTGADKERAEAIRGILNSGYERGGCYTRCVGEGSKMVVMDFNTFGAKALAGIGCLNDTVASRSIPIRMKRARRGKVGRFRRCGKEGRKILGEGADLKVRLEAWCICNLGVLADAEPKIPEPLSDRQADCCEPLLAIADEAGGDWPTAARAALVELCVGAQEDDDSIGVRLLADIKRVLYPKDDDGNPLPEIERIASGDLAKSLGEMEDRPWAEWGKMQKPITQPQIARLLSRYDIAPKTVRLPGDRRLKGYEREQFAEAWALYLPPDSPTSPSTPDLIRDSVTTRENTGEEGAFQCVTADSCHASENGVSANKDGACHGVTDREPGADGETGEAAEPVFEEGQL